MISHIGPGCFTPWLVGLINAAAKPWLYRQNWRAEHGGVRAVSQIADNAGAGDTAVGMVFAPGQKCTSMA